MTQHKSLAGALEVENKKAKPKRRGLGLPNRVYDQLTTLAEALTEETGVTYSRAKTVEALMAHYEKTRD